jgi:hypothetical protein
MAVMIEAPNEVKYDNGNIHLFTAGSIQNNNNENGMAEEWQVTVYEKLKDIDNLVILNPRRNDWDSSTWTQSIDDPQFSQQVNWELDMQEQLSDIIMYYFEPTSTAPITLLELGLCASDDSIDKIVCCPEGYFRKGNVDIICDRYGIQMVSSLEDMIEKTRILIEEIKSERLKDLWF